MVAATNEQLAESTEIDTADSGGGLIAGIRARLFGGDD
jgi:hypothetical protein